MKGESIGNWIVQDLIDDSGGNGIVWLVQTADGSRAAIKVLRQFENDTKGEKRRNRFLSEIKSLKYITEMSIPRVMPVLDHGFIGSDQPWYTMPLAEPLIVNGTANILATMVDVCDTIARLHEIGMVHRDIKPSNLLSLDSKVIVSDFGLARMIGDENFTATGERVGSMGYTATECVGPSDEPRFACDVYALAKTAWVLLTGSDRPPNGELRSPDDELKDRIAAPCTFSLDSIQDLLFAASARDPNDRPTARQLCDGLTLALNPIQLPPPQNASPALRARTLFGDSAARNRRDLEVTDLYQRWCRDSARHWAASWKETIETLGWRPTNGSGGNMGFHIQQLPPGWKASMRYFFTGQINSQTFDIALTYRQKKVSGEARLLFGLTIAIQHHKDPRRPTNTEDCERIIVSRDFNTFTKGPQVESVFNEVLGVLGNPENQFRTLECLRKVVDEAETPA